MRNEDRLSPFEGRFVLLKHDMPSDSGAEFHWDLMFEHGGRLITFQLSSLPNNTDSFKEEQLPKQTSPTDELHGGDGCQFDSPTGYLARRLPDHRMLYLEYEGDVSGGRGRVRRVSSGYYRAEPPGMLANYNTECGPQKWLFKLEGDNLGALISFTDPRHNDALDTTLFQIHQWRILP